jgi:hypothetical protein
VNGRRTRGWITLYTLAFVGLILAGGALAFAVQDFLSSEAPLWLSVALSAATIALAILAAALPRRKR